MKYIIQHNLLLLYFLFFSNILFAQEIEVRDSETGFPLSGVLINNDDKTTYTVTDENGYASLSIFKKNETLSIQIYGYQDQIINLKEEGKFIIYMDGEEEALEEVILSVARSKTSLITGIIIDNSDLPRLMLVISLYLRPKALR